MIKEMKKKLSILMLVVVMLMCDNVYASSACSEKENYIWGRNKKKEI